MPTNYQSRVIVCVTSLVLALFVIFGFPPSRLFNPNLSLIQKTNLNPGIDMVGGVRLIYEIQPAPGMPKTANLATEEMIAIRRRVDPSGLRNLVWRPEGSNRLEIEMPLSPEAAQRPKFEKAFNAANAELDATNIHSDDVINAVEKLTGQARSAQLAKLASDDATRIDLFKQLSDTYDKIQALQANPQHIPMEVLVTQLQPLSDSYEAMKATINSTNLRTGDFEAILEQANSEDDAVKQAGQAKLDDIKKRNADFPSRMKAISDVQSAFKDYDSVRMAITSAEGLEQLLQGAGVLEFHILADNVTSTSADLQAMKARLAPNGRGPLPLPGDTIQWMEVDHVDEFDRPDAAPETMEWNGKHYMPVLVTPDASMTRESGKWGLENANLGADDTGQAAVAFKFDTYGGNLFSHLTSYWSDEAKRRSGGQGRARLAIVLDGKVISAPSIHEAINSGSGIITGGGAGGFNKKETDYLIDTLNAGSLPAQLSSEPISKEEVGPTLGADNLAKGLLACGFGLVVVGIFLVSYYYLAGVVAFVAVLMNLVLILGVMAGMGATFTLPSIAGIVLTVGTAVDANVLIFERLREEQHRGLSLRMALRNSYNQARSAIIDSNMTSIITSLCLYAFGSEEVKGFGLTLIIGILASLFTALYVTKTIFGIMIDKFGVTHLGSFPLSFPKWDKALRPNWDWMGKAWIFYTFSTIMIVIGMTLFVNKIVQGQMMDIEFASGTSMQFELNQQMDQEAVRKVIDAASEKDPAGLPSPSVVAVGSDQLHYEVISPGSDRQKAKDVVLAAMKPYLHIQLPSSFDDVDQDAGDATNRSILPITSQKFTVDGYSPPAAGQHAGGVAIVMRNISPPLSVDQIHQRLVNERVSTSASDLDSVDYVVQGPGDSTTPTNFAVVIGWNPAVSYTIDPAKWSTQLAKPLWGLIRDAVHRPPSFEKETNFDPQVAGEMQQDAFLALFFSIGAIMIYIWVRFGNLTFGTATVVALLHDTIFTLAAIGFAHYIADYWHHNFLQIEPFRINLTLVAGVLTIMGYSMIDTIVVFDRIRENRGKYGHLDRAVINTAINQTLSRTLLTAGTTIMTVSFMYFVGGEGIHGFTFVLLVGILVGTYSSVAIAAPLLLWHRRAHGSDANQRSVSQLQRTAG